MGAIGGYFSLELPLCGEYHKNAIMFNIGRNCLEYILRAREYNKVYLSFKLEEVVFKRRWNFSDPQITNMKAFR